MVNKDIVQRLLNNIDGKVDPEQVFAIFDRRLNDFADYTRSIRDWLARVR